MSQPCRRLPGLPRLSVAARPRLLAESGTFHVDVDDETARRWRFTWAPYQAVRVWTIDLWRPPDGEWHPLAVSEVPDSMWLDELSAQLAKLQPDATFMDHARHFVVHAPDNVIEIAAWNLEFQPLGERGSNGGSGNVSSRA